jgi:crossover junction endodeoxyribonuclease RuvC
MARSSVRDLWKAKLEGRLPACSGVEPVRAGRGRVETAGPAAMRTPFEGCVLGIDPSLRGTGLAVLEFARGRPPVLLHSRTVSVPRSADMPACLAAIHRAVSEVLAMHRVRHVALEQTIYVQNFQTAQILGAARGAAIAAAAVHGEEVFEYPPLRVKQAVVGFGRASKEQVARTVMGILGHGRTLALDEADAAGVALTHAFTWRG